MPDRRQSKTLARLKQLKQANAMAAQRQAMAAQEQVTDTELSIAAMDQRVVEEASAMADYADTPALGRWADLMDHRRDGLLQRKAAEQRVADALAQKAAAAQLTVEQYGLLLKNLERQQRDQQQRAAALAEWEALTQALWHDG
jgi:hypothetical protein